MPVAPPSEESIFTEALELPSVAARAAFLEKACGGDAQLRGRIEKLLKSHTGAGSFLVQPVAVTTDQPLVERPGTIIGPYKLLQVIGEGGMGVVYMADQEQPVRRRVALKIIKPGMDSKQVIARFEAERQALAMMDHQNIARVLDAGTTESGRPFFVMELVHGVPLTKFCNDNRLTLRQRLDLFVSVCHAIQHAHQKGIIHRDIKPGNILVTMYDDKPVPKVIDFGVAKAVEQRLTDKTLFTQFGMLVGTFEYMSPEQAEMNAYGVDTRSDVYSLGVLLYELLTGTTPLDHKRLRDAALVELVRLIKEEEPPRPSIRLSTSTSLPKVAAAFQTEPARLSQLVRGELDWIVMKCLEKDRTRRYETANGLARDVQRYLQDEPVEACPPSLMYRFSKIARKHRGLLTTAAAFVALLLVGFVASACLTVWATNSQQAANHALAREQLALREAVAEKKRLGTAMELANEGIEFYYQKDRAAALDKFAQAVEVQSELETIYVHRKALYLQVGLWDRAAEDYAKLLSLSKRAHVHTCHEHALLRLYVGDEPGYRAACQEIFRQYGSSDWNEAQHRLVRAFYLSPNGVESPADLVRRAENSVAANNQPWTRSAAAVAHLRAGSYEQVVSRSREFTEPGYTSPGGVHRSNYFPLAIALHHLRQEEEAKAALAKGDAAIDEWIKTMLVGPLGTMPVDWNVWLECLLFQREAKTLITGSTPEDDPRLSTLRERGLAAITYGEAFTFIEAARKQVAQSQWDQAAASFDKALAQLPDDLSLSASATPLCREIVQRPEVFDAIIKLRPRDSRLWYARGHALMGKREWAKASADLTKTLELPTHSHERWRTITTFELAALRLLAGDEAGYRELRQAVLNSQNQVDDPFIGNVLSRICTLQTGEVTDWSVPIQLADVSADMNPREAWYRFASGAAQYRAGHDEEAVSCIKDSEKCYPTWKGRGQNYVILALACQRLGRPDEANQWLAKTKEWLDEMNRTVGKSDFDVSQTAYSTDWLTVLILLPEAERLLVKGAKQ